MHMNHFEHIIGRSAELQQLLNTASIISQTDVTVLIEGDTGTGKELLARAMHAASSRAAKPFIAVNCAALTGLPEMLTVAQLFGHKQGVQADLVGAEIPQAAADSEQVGFIQQSDGGTLFLDEVGELSLAVQARLLGFIEHGEYQRSTESRSDVRIVASTSCDLQQQVTNGEFREDLFYRLNVIPLSVPSLIKRAEDIPLLGQHFMALLAKQHNLPEAKFSKAAINKLKQYEWPGNCRELRNLCESLLLLLQGRAIDEMNLPAYISSARVSTGSAFKLPASGIKLDELEVDLLHQALQATAGNKSRAARMLGITRDVFLYRLKKYSIG